VRHVDAAPVVHVHLRAHGGDGGIEEEGGVRGAGDAPDDVGGGAEEGGGFGEDAGGFIGEGDVGG
jgi:hypothetical protein